MTQTTQRTQPFPAGTDGRGPGPASATPPGSLRPLARGLRRLRREYAAGEPRPLGGYLVTLGGYAGVLAGLAAAVRATGRRLPERPEPADVVLLGVATHKLSRLLAKEAVTSPLRAPFTRFDGAAGSAEVNEQVREHGSTRHAMGELLSCPFCLAVWISTGLTAGLVLAPRLTRLVATAGTAVAISDFLQMAYATAKGAAERAGASRDERPES